MLIKSVSISFWFRIETETGWIFPYVIDVMYNEPSKELIK